MVDVYNKNVAKDGFSEFMHAVPGNLLHPDSNSAQLEDKENKEYWNFDMVAVSVSHLVSQPL